MMPSMRFLQFGIVGVAGFLADYGSYLLFSSFMPFYLARLLSFVVAVCTTWLLNRSWTFKQRPSRHPWPKELLFYFVSMSLGGAFNLGVSLLLLNFFHQLPHIALFALAAGSIAGLISNYLLSSRIIFNTRAKGL
ncbi:GtrA family protein [Aquitalea sp. USM4]|nr:GtrA family protein [Aquitalea sp. USM4]